MSDYTILNRMFTQKKLRDLIYRKNSKIYEEIVCEYLSNLNNS